MLVTVIVAFRPLIFVGSGAVLYLPAFKYTPAPAKTKDLGFSTYASMESKAYWSAIIQATKAKAPQYHVIERSIMQDEPTDRKIRVSMLGSYQECGLMAAVKQWPNAFIARGYKIRQLQPHVGGVVGSSVHTAIENLYTQVADGELPSYSKAVDAGMATYEKAEHILFDEITRGKNDAAKQVHTISKTYFGTLGYQIKPQVIEGAFKANLDAFAKGWEFTGHPDLIYKQKKLGALVDYKTGRQERLHLLMVSGYVNILSANTIDIDVASTAFMRRLPPDKPPEPPKVKHYAVSMIRGHAVWAVKRILRDFEAFDKTGDPNAFPVNPSSFLCNERFCPVYGTKTCSVWHLKEVAK